MYEKLIVSETDKMGKSKKLRQSQNKSASMEKNEEVPMDKLWDTNTNNNTEEKTKSELGSLGQVFPTFIDATKPDTANVKDVVLQSKDTKGTKGTKEEILDLNVNFCKQTTAHGWGRVGRATNHVVRSMWIVISIIALLLNVGHVFLLTRQFMQYRTEIKIVMEQQEVSFPSISICNLIPWSLDSANEMIANPNTSTHQWKMLTDNLSIFDELAQVINYTDQFDWFKYRMQQPTGYFENIGDEVLTLGHSLKDFVLSCTFELRNCNYSHFKYFVTANFFNCFTFSSVELDSGRTTGPNEGLSLILYLEAFHKYANLHSSYFTRTNIGNAAGLRVVIHEPGTRPSPKDQGFDVPPGFSANIGLTVNRHVNMGKPYGPCIPTDQNEPPSVFDLYKYSSNDCILTCQANYIMEQCGCISSVLPLPNKTKTDLHFCGHWNVTTADDFREYLDRLVCEAQNMSNFLDNMTMGCHCDPPCDSMEYDLDVSYSYWPVRHSQAQFYDTFILNHPLGPQLKAYKHLSKYNITELINDDLIRGNFIRLNVFRKTMVVRENWQQPSYDMPKLLSDLGGTFGLWIGMSAISWCEVIELLIGMAVAGCKGVRRLYMA